MTKKQAKFSFFLFFLLLLLATLAGILIFSTSVSKFRQDKSTPQTACGAQDVLSQSGEFDPLDLTSIWLEEPAEALLAEVEPSQLAQAPVLGETAEDKWIEVDLTEQRMKAHQGDKTVYDFPLSSGKYAPTPTGEYEIWYKVRYTKMEGGVKGTGTYYYLANVPFTMFFYKGYGLHGTYWHNSFGQPMSHGCVNLSIINAQKLFNWSEPVLPSGKSAIRASKSNPGTKVVVHGRAPRV